MKTAQSIKRGDTVKKINSVGGFFNCIGLVEGVKGSVAKVNWYKGADGSDYKSADGSLISYKETEEIINLKVTKDKNR